ncbi:MAG: FliO/MopB family protein [Armatimonadota bacterium]
MRHLGLAAAVAFTLCVERVGVAAPQTAGETASEDEQAPLSLDAGGEPQGAESPTAYLVRALLSLGIVIVLIYLAYYGLRLLRTGRLRGHRGADHIRVLDSVRLDGDRALYVVSIGERTLVLGGAGNELRLICELREDEAASLRDSTGAKAPGGTASEDAR